MPDAGSLGVFRLFLQVAIGHGPSSWLFLLQVASESDALERSFVAVLRVGPL